MLCKVSKCGTKYLKPTKCFYFDLRDANGTRKRIKGFADLKATEAYAVELEKKIARKAAGFADANEEHARRPLEEHVADFETHLHGNGATPAYVSLVVGRITAMFSGCQFSFFSDVDGTSVSQWLTALRRGSAPIAVPDKDSFTPAEAAKLLGVSMAAVRATMKRLKLSSSGHGKARIFPRSTLEALVQTQTKGAGPETINHYLRSLRNFFRWGVLAKRFPSNPVDTISFLNTSTDLRRQRRELSADEVSRLLVAARSSTQTFCGLNGADRHCLYLLAVSTGLRANAMANLTPSNFELDTPSPVVTLPARFNKSKRTQVQSLRADVAAVMAAYLAGKPTDSPIWPGNWKPKAADMLRIDLRAAGIDCTVAGADGPEHVDFHALRHTFLTLCGRSGVGLRELQALASHSKPELAVRYTHVRLHDTSAAV